MYKYIAVFGFALFVTTATAEEIPIPRYDIAAYCKAAVSKWPETIYSSCEKQEVEARRFTASIWNAVEAVTKENCINNSSANNFSLAICLTGNTRNQSLWGKVPPIVK